MDVEKELPCPRCNGKLKEIDRVTTGHGETMGTYQCTYCKLIGEGIEYGMPEWHDKIPWEPLGNAEKLSRA